MPPADPPNSTEPPDFNGLGVPEHVAGYFRLAAELGQTFTDRSPPEFGDVIGETSYRMMLADATGRWRFRGGWSEPSRLVPGDVLALSALHALALAMAPGDIPGSDPVFRTESTSLARSILDARNYWLPAAAVGAVLSSDLPAQAVADVRLPAKTCALWFAQPAEIPPAAIPATLGMHAAALRDFAGTAGKPYIERPLAHTFDTLHHLGQGGSGLLEGVLLSGDEDGRPLDAVGWFIRREDPAINRAVARALVLGRASLAGWRGSIDLAAAIMAWGDWKAPERLPTAIPWDADRATRRQLRKGRTRDIEEAGGLTNVVVLDTRRRSSSRGDGLGTHASPITHTRRDHFRRVAVGPRDEQRREWRWFPPTIVNPEGPRPDALRVYRLPLPPH